MSTTNTGRKAERAAANYLEMRGFHILEMNWRRPRCEIDIVARKDDVIYLVEVKYRKNNNQGSGLEYITATKLKQMRYAAETWVDEGKYTGEYQLAAIEVAGPEFAIEHFIDEVV
jgi:putative endonuclease